MLKARAFAFDPVKDAWLRRTRGIGFEDIVAAIERGVAYSLIRHPNREKYAHQMILEILIKEYGHAIPCVLQEDGTIFMKTIYPSRKTTKKLGRRTTT